MKGLSYTKYELYMQFSIYEYGTELLGWTQEIILTNAKMKTSTHISLTSHFWDIGKQCRPRSDTAESGVWSGSSLFANRIIYSK